MKKIVVNVYGLTCHICLKKIEGKLLKLNGVEKVIVYRRLRKIFVTFDEGQTEERKLRSLIPREDVKEQQRIIRM
ncbi:heavy-metal-associated domain-containing protein [Evansella sp. AB-P1]|uniref:heavy-metal-associated domain-containing protein n=1 Tax=Evansella sp. AB-P1 TaxID=3037653 RepID=UPI00241EEC36|nr:heavy-metal-associated domain-containing protein [Evansella sp. AB-P1]MDG5789377.1 heavy-metal-associated domain-containing protein [Evansella sp. AB-P1]